MERSEQSEKGQEHGSGRNHGDDHGQLIEVETEIEDQTQPQVFTVENDHRFVARVRAHVEAPPDMQFFERDRDEPITAPPRGRKAIRLVGYRCRQVVMEVRYEHHAKSEKFPPSATVDKVLKWAVSKRGFNLDPMQAAKANLILPGATSPLPRGDAIGKYVKHGHCALVVDLTLQDFTNG